MTWKGRYLKGRETYLELFSVGDLPGQDAEFGSAGLGTSVERAGDLANTVPLLRAGGFTLKTLPGGGVVAQSGGTRIQLDSVPREQAGLKQIQMSLNKPLPSRTEERIGRSTLSVGPGARAVWTFDAPAE